MDGGGRKQKINPCERKGEVQARKTEGNPAYRGAYRRYGACECCFDRCDFNKRGERVPLNFALDEKDTEARALWVKSKNRLPKGQLLVSPCTETFRDNHSSATRLYKRLLGDRTAFRGCQDVEAYLIREKLVRLWISNRETLELSDLLDLVVPSEEDYRVPVLEGDFGRDAKSIASAYSLGVESERQSDANKIASRLSILAGSMAELLRPAPLSFRQSQARRLFEEGHFGKSLKLRLALFLISRNITEPDLIAQVAPELDYAEYKKLEGVVNRELDTVMPERARRFAKYLESLKYAQREAIEQVYLKNEYGLTQEEVAKKLGISIHSLTDRLKGAKKKLKDAYPEYRKKAKKAKPKKNEKNAGESAEKVNSPREEVAVILINPVTHERTQIFVDRSSKDRIRMKTGVNKFEIKRWIQERCPIPYPAI